MPQSGRFSNGYTGTDSVDDWGSRMAVFSFRMLGFVWAGAAATAAVSAAVLEVSYVAPPALVAAASPPPMVIDPAPAPAPLPRPAVRHLAVMPLPPAPPPPPRLRVARTERHAPAPIYRWGAAYPGPYEMVRPYYPQPGYYGWQPHY